MDNGDTAVAAKGPYRCSDGTCAASSSMLFTEDLDGEFRCAVDDASCVIDGELSRRGLKVYGTGSGVLTLRALSFVNGKVWGGGGVYIAFSAIVDIQLCAFSNCRATDVSDHK
jgi:hypothetical protein